MVTLVSSIGLRGMDANCRCLWKINSLVLVMFTINYYHWPYLVTFRNSVSKPTSFFSGTKRLASSAYFVIWFVEPIGLKSIMQMINRVGPISEPWTIERLIIRVNDNFPFNWTYWLRTASQGILNCVPVFNGYIVLKLVNGASVVWTEKSNGSHRSIADSNLNFWI